MTSSNAGYSQLYIGEEVGGFTEMRSRGSAVAPGPNTLVFLLSQRRQLIGPIQR
jgi:hypothetical protein